MLRGFFRKLLAPRSPAEDDRRREFILNILLISSIGLMLAANLINLYYFFFTAYEKQDSLSVGGFLLILGIFIGLFVLSRSGHFKAAARAFIGLYFIITTLLALLWGIDLPAVPLFYGLIIIMAGILISARRALLTTAGVAATMILVGGLQIYKEIPVNSYWRRETMDLGNIFLFAIILFIIAVISWLFNRDLEKSLERARSSEAALKQERDSLEIKVEERAAQIKKMQIEKMNQLYRLAEFGRLASGIFHDLVNPLTALSLSLSQAKKEGDKKTDNNEAGGNKEGSALNRPYLYLQQSLTASKKIEDLISALRRQLHVRSSREIFSLNEEVRQILQILNYKLVKNNLSVHFDAAGEIKLSGDPVRFSQIVLNLLSNAIDAYENIPPAERLPIKVELKEASGKIYLTVKDSGAGIAPENLPKIFEPFFTTKGSEKGLGLGLATTKNIVEKDFGGRICSYNRQSGGAKFIVKLPR